MNTEHEFKAPADVAQTASELEAARALAPKALIGTWNACDGTTRSVVRVVITPAEGEIKVRAFGACSPNPCDWGSVPGLMYAPDVSSSAAIAFTAHFKFSFLQTELTGVLDNGSLRLETFNHFTDASNRSDYYTRGYFCKLLTK